MTSCPFIESKIIRIFLECWFLTNGGILRWKGSRPALKLLVVSDVGRRNALSPFFQTNKVMAANLRASVRRAIGAFLPLASKAA
jgi:hypothetical protein